MPALHRFTEAIATHAGVRPDAMRLDDWRDVLTAALEVVNRASGRRRSSSTRCRI
ncbi:hypothetical protein ACFWFF_36315 [Streptomyces sp. NPDC060223]|uniref:hypothetical protein n=1 Tax=unclassified Streptomyces TaxID=2593676 RepID=UPI00362E9DD1